jgi:hypothetical protein
MPTKSGFNPDDFLPRFLSDEPLPLVDEPLLLADEPDEQGIGKAWDRAVVSSRVLTASILVATATAIGIAILSVGNRVTLLADVTASQVDKSALQLGADQLTPTIQSTADAQALPPTAKDAPTRDEIAAASEPVGQNQTEKNEVPEALFRQFQASAAEKDTQAQVGQPIQETSGRVAQHVPAQVAENGPASVRPMQRHRHVRAVQNARAEIRPVQNPRKLRREQNARLQTPPAQRARAQDQSAQNAQAAPWLLQALGWRN